MGFADNYDSEKDYSIDTSKEYYMRVVSVEEKLSKEKKLPQLEFQFEILKAKDGSEVSKGERLRHWLTEITNEDGSLHRMTHMNIQELLNTFGLPLKTKPSPQVFQGKVCLVSLKTEINGDFENTVINRFIKKEEITTTQEPDFTEEETPDFSEEETVENSEDIIQEEKVNPAPPINEEPFDGQF